MGSVNYSNSANGWDVTINWSCDWDDSEAYMTIQINQNSYGRTFQVVQRSNTGNRYDSGSYLSVGTEYLLYVYKNSAYSQQAGPFTVTAPSRPTYTIKYDANGGSGAPSSQTKYYGTNLTLSSTKPTWAGHTFVKWNTASDGSGTSYQPGATYSGNAALNLYAIWTLDSYTVSYDANGGTGAPGNQVKYYGQALTLTTAIPSRPGYTFFVWRLNQGGTWVSYDPGSQYTENAAATFFALWTANKYKIKFNANGGSGSMSDQNMVYDTAANLTANAFSWAGHTFLGWATSATGSVVYKDGVSVSNLVSASGGSITLYAVWSINAITITFDATTNGGSTSETSRSINYGYAIGTLPTATRQYYKFSGWFTAPTGGTKVTASTTFTAATTLYAQFVIDASVKAKVGGQWKPGIPYVKVNGVWRKGYAWAKTPAGWKQGHG